MKIILISDYDGLGKAGELVDVKPGFARNKLLPNGFALRASKKNIALSSIKTIFAHSQAFAQSQSWMSKNLPQAIKKDVTSNSQGVLQSKRSNYFCPHK